MRPRRHRWYEATFQPKRTDDLRPEARERIGQRTVWTVGWMIGPGDHPDYQRQYAMIQHARGDAHWNIGWTPECDLADFG